MVVARDISGNGNHGTYVGGVVGASSLLATDGDRAAQFNGTSGYVNVDAVVADLVGVAQWAMGCWCRPLANDDDFSAMAINRQEPDYNVALLQAGYSGGAGRWELNTAKPPPATTGLSQLTTEPGMPHTLGDPVFVVANCGNASQQVFTNGSLVASTSYAGQTIDSSMRASIGQEYDSPTGTSAHTPGVLDDAFIIPRHLTAGEVSALYAAAQTDGGFREGVLALGPAGYWRLNEFGGFYIGSVVIGP